MSTDKNTFILKELKDKDNPPSFKPTATATNTKPRLVRSPTPHTLVDHSSLIVPDDLQEELGNSFGLPLNLSFGSTADSARDNTAQVGGNANVAQTNDDTSKLDHHQKLSIFATIAKLTAEDIEIARCTKANTKANSMIGKLTRLEVASSSVSSHQESRQLKRKSFSLDSSKENYSISSDNESESSEDNIESDSLPSSFKSQDLRHQNQDLKTGLDCLSSESTLEPKKKKTVRFDERNNTVFTYRRGSTISFSFSENELMSGSNGGDEEFSDDDDDDDDDDDFSYEYDDDDLANDRNQSWHSFLDSSGRLLASSPWRFWSSLTAPDAANHPAILSATPGFQVQNPIMPSLLSSPLMGPSTESNLLSQESISQEALSQENLSQELFSRDQIDNRGLFMNIASSLDRLLSPSYLRLSPSPTPSIDSNLDRDENNAVSEIYPSRSSSPTAQQGSSLPPATFLEQSSKPETSVNHDGQETPSTTRVTGGESQCSLTDEDVVMEEDPQLESLFKRVDQVRLMSPPKFNSSAASSTSRHSRSTSIARANPRPPILSPSTSKPSFKPPRLARSTSFSATSSQKAPPLLRREASTTSILDAFL
ncbi:hypothetical protein BGZ76_011547 [Entomortierella beljakovae]|nr:hypothetical protein BGZ76_011547 [Entomortierella beljakovae]